MILKDLDRGALHEVWKCLKLKELDRGAFWGEFVTLLILKELDRGAEGRNCRFSCKCLRTKGVRQGRGGALLLSCFQVIGDIGVRWGAAIAAAGGEGTLALQITGVKGVRVMRRTGPIQRELSYTHSYHRAGKLSIDN